MKYSSVFRRSGPQFSVLAEQADSANFPSKEKLRNGISSTRLSLPSEPGNAHSPYENLAVSFKLKEKSKVFHGSSTTTTSQANLGSQSKGKFGDYEEYPLSHTNLPRYKNDMALVGNSGKKSQETIKQQVFRIQEDLLANATHRYPTKVEKESVATDHEEFQFDEKFVDNNVIVASNDLAAQLRSSRKNKTTSTRLKEFFHKYCNNILTETLVVINNSIELEPKNIRPQLNKQFATREKLSAQYATPQKKIFDEFISLAQPENKYFLDSKGIVNQSSLDKFPIFICPTEAECAKRIALTPAINEMLKQIDILKPERQKKLIDLVKNNFIDLSKDKPVGRPSQKERMMEAVMTLEFHETEGLIQTFARTLPALADARHPGEISKLQKDVIDVLVSLHDSMLPNEQRTTKFAVGEMGKSLLAAYKAALHSAHTDSRIRYQESMAAKGDKTIPTSSRATDLIGETIAPHVASKFIKTINFDGFGRVQDLKENISKNVLKELRQAVIKPLTQQYASPFEECGRIERDCLIQAMHLLGQVKDPLVPELLIKARDIWLGSKFEDDAVHEFLINGAIELSHLPKIAQALAEIGITLEKSTTPQQKLDNPHGRKFDSEFVNALIEKPPPAVLAASARVGIELADFLTNEFSSASHSRNPDSKSEIKNWSEWQSFCKNISSHLEKPRPWHGAVPEIKQFLLAAKTSATKASPHVGESDAAFQALMTLVKKDSTGLDVVLVNSLAALFTMHGTDSSNEFYRSMRWAEPAQQNYIAVINGANSTRTPGMVILTKQFGTGLSHHPESSSNATFVLSKKNAYNRIPTNPDNLTLFEHQALANGHSILGGSSGTTNILSFLWNHIERKDASFKSSQALLGAMMFLVYDGGHSINEVMGVDFSLSPSRKYGSTSSAKRALELPDGSEELKRLRDPKRVANDDGPATFSVLHGRALKLANYKMDYRHIHEVTKSDEQSGVAVEKALNVALDRTIAMFDQHSDYAKKNNSLIGVISKNEK